MIGRRTFLHSCAQRLGLQRLSSTIAMRVILSAMMVKSEQSDSYCTARYPNKSRRARRFGTGHVDLIRSIRLVPHLSGPYVRALQAINPLQLARKKASESLPALMAKGSASKDKKKPSEKKGKTEETTVDKGGKVRTYCITPLLSLVAD